MATVTATPTATSLSISGTTRKTGTISWTCPTLPSGATITSCVLTGFVNNKMSKGSATVKVNNTNVTLGANFTVNLGTSNSTTSVSTSGVGNNRNSAGTITFTDLVYTVTYTVPVTEYTVTFKDWDGTTLSTQTIEEGKSATPPTSPTRVGYKFNGWDKSYSNVTSDLTITATYIPIKNTYVGSSGISKVYVGTKAITRIYVGEFVVFNL